MVLVLETFPLLPEATRLLLGEITAEAGLVDGADV